MNTLNPLFNDRESWLNEAANLAFDDLLMPIVEKAGYEYTRPNFRISVGFPKHSRSGKAIAVCFKRSASTDGVNEIFINPEIDSPLEVMAAMVHEQIHAIDDCASGHRHFFAHVARKAGLEGHLTSTVPGAKLTTTLLEYADLLGPFPHSRMQISATHKKDGTRQRKVFCNQCNFTFRTSLMQIMRMKAYAPCPCCDDGALVTII